MTGWLRALEGDAQDIVVAYRGIEAQFVSVRREVRRRAVSVILGAGPG